jgi:hypothetical protein
MSSEPSLSPSDTPSVSSAGGNHTITEITPHDPLYSRRFHCDEEILEELQCPDSPWDALHHRALFLPQEALMPPSHNPIYAVETKDFIPSGPIDWFNNPIPAPDAFEEGNLANISPTIKIDISIKPGIVEEIIIGAACTPQEIAAYKALFQEYRDIFAWSYTEMPGLDPSIVEHRIDTWPDITPVRQKQRPLHPSKAAAIKAEIDKLRTAGFIYPIAYKPVDQGSIRVCTDFRDLYVQRTTSNAFHRSDYRRLRRPRGSLLYGRILTIKSTQIRIHYPVGYVCISCHAFRPQKCCNLSSGLMTYIFHDLAASSSPTWTTSRARSKKRTQPLNHLSVTASYI